MPDLAKLEKKYANELVVIGVHSAKFENEKNSESIRKAILRYGLRAPGRQRRRPEDLERLRLLLLADPRPHRPGGQPPRPDVRRGQVRTARQGDRQGDRGAPGRRRRSTRSRSGSTRPSSATRSIARCTSPARSSPTRRAIACSSPTAPTTGSSSPTSTGNGIAVAGTGAPGRKDGPFAEAQFDDPQGMALNGDTLYVADRKNHCIRELDLKAKTVKTIAGTGEQDRDRGEGGPAPASAASTARGTCCSTATGCSSPWPGTTRSGR